MDIANNSSYYKKLTKQRDFVTWKGEIEENKCVLSENKTEILETITIRLPDYLVRELPEEESAIYVILKLGLMQLKTEKAIERYKKGGGSLAKVAELAGISIRDTYCLCPWFRTQIR